MHTSEREALRTRLPLYTYFCDFYGQLVDIKRGLAALPAGHPAPVELTAAAVHARLVESLREQYSSVQRDCTPDQLQIYRDAQYAMAALADEQLLLEVRWAGCGEWLDLMLETALFDTRHAGVRFYRLIDSLLAVAQPSQAHAELGLVLLGALEVGFRGALRGDSEAPALAARRADLVKFVTDVRGDDAGGHAFEQAYEHTIGPREPEPASCRLAPLSPWFNAARLALVAYLLVSAAIWFIVMFPFERLVANDPAAQRVRAEQKLGNAVAANDAGTATGPTQTSGAVSVAPVTSADSLTVKPASKPAPRGDVL
ncbi:DotU family type IV/VI secretion system protein [Paraburkholderia sp. D15]|uniref:DotU family type IV/VI secretion system protein n=1 Tax=Paraburkholderia sp. D15 TaxID=2880218 RepID=UPI00247ACF2D|nr:DotU family type IV/VI secretion system protein [Paraburkholderia sp. D15]WGS52880.1 DotU family type IV/VI secretion system protein [Paraburkholderia sp. D15]